MSVKNDYIKLETSAKQIECLKDASEKVAKANFYLMNQVGESFDTDMVSMKKDCTTILTETTSSILEFMHLIDKMIKFWREYAEAIKKGSDTKQTTQQTEVIPYETKFVINVSDFDFKRSVIYSLYEIKSELMEIITEVNKIAGSEFFYTLPCDVQSALYDELYIRQKYVVKYIDAQIDFCEQFLL